MKYQDEQNMKRIAAVVGSQRRIIFALTAIVATMAEKSSIDRKAITERIKSSEFYGDPGERSDDFVLAIDDLVQKILG